MAVVKIREAFRRFTSENKDIGLSVGYVLMDSKFPFSKAADILSVRLSEAKGYWPSISDDYRKDAIALFGECVPWRKRDVIGRQVDGLDELLDFAGRLEAGLESKELSKGLIYDMLRLWKRSFDQREGRELEKARLEVHSYMPYLEYKLVRNVKPEHLRNYEEHVLRHMPWIRVPATWVSLRSRSERNE